MAAIDQLVNVNITQQTKAVAQASFSIPLIIGATIASWSTTDHIHSYNQPADMLTDGFTTSSPEYKYALEMFEQPLVPTQFYVAYRAPAVAQVDTFAVSTLVATGHAYHFTLNGSLITYTSSSDTQQSILTALLAAINTAFPTDPPVTGVVAGTGSGALLTLTSSVAGQGVSYTAVDADLALVSVDANHGIADDLNTIMSVNSIWYGVVLCSNVDSDILQLAAAVEPLLKIFIAASNDSAIGTSSVTDIGSVMKGKSYNRTGLMFSPGSYNLGIDAAWIGGQLPFTPGANNWALKSLGGISADALTPNQVSNCIGNPVGQIVGKNVNVYQVVGGSPITQMGTMASGQFIDVTVGVDWLQSTVQTNIFSALISAPKIPYTDTGVGILKSAIRAAIDQGVVNGLIDGDSPITITAPAVLSVPASQRANRVAPTISFSCRLAGAFNAVVVNGTVSV